VGSGVSEDPQPRTSTPYGDIFDEFLPHYLAIGMPYDLYWDGEYGTKKAFREAYRIRVETQQQMQDVNNWYMGQYIMAALGAVPLLVNGFVPKGAERHPYPDKPFLVQEEEKKKEQEKLRNEEERRKKEEDQSKMAMALFQAMISQFNENVEKRLEREKHEGSGQ